jgi:coenzyme F420 hydrogenase subunit beta
MKHQAALMGALYMTSGSDKEQYRNVDGILKVVADKLCHRCGACIGLCPASTLGVDRNGYPTKIDECIECNICVQSCSGLGVDYNTLGNRMYGERYRYGDMMGPVIEAYVAHAVDETIRNNAASGGVVTQIFDYLLESGQVKGAIVVVEDPENPARGKGIVARSREELLQSQQSRYTTSPHLHILNTIHEEDGPFALVALPCQIHSLRKRQMFDPRWTKKIPIIIGLFCHYSLPMSSTQEAAALLAPPKTHLVHTRYRQRDERGWPFNTLEMTFSDGSIWRSPYGPAQTFNIISRISPLGRCLQCLDAAAEFSDISICDPWIRDERGRWKYEEPGGFSGVLVRTERGAAVLRESVAAGRLSAKSIPPEEIRKGQQQMMVEKKLRTAFRIDVRRKLKMNVPSYPMEFGPHRKKVVVHEVMFWFMRFLPAFRPVRAFLLQLGFSRVGRYLIRRRMKKRERRAASGKPAV